MVGLVACLLQACQRPPIYQQESFVFGTRVEITITDVAPAQAKLATQAVLSEFDRLHRQYHAWKPSELTALNQAIADGKPHTVTPELAGLIEQSQKLAAQGGYLFDPGIGKLIQAWGFQSDEFIAQLPRAEDIAAWSTQKPLSQHPSIAHLNLKNLTVTSQSRLVALDFGGYLKGWALDRAHTILTAHQIQNALINIGGNILAIGQKHGKPWQVGIQHPRKPGVLAVVDLRDGEAVGTSGDYQRFFELNGQRYPHLLDPRTGQPAQATQAVTILISPGIAAGTRSDASSKPIFIAGTDWLATAHKLGVQNVLRIDANGRLETTVSMAQRMKRTHQETGNLSIQIVDTPLTPQQPNPQ